MLPSQGRRGATKRAEANDVKYGVQCHLADCIENCHRAEIFLECIFTLREKLVN